MPKSFKWSDAKITGWIYFIEYHDSGPVKIGYAKNVDKRLCNLQTACPYELRVLVAAPGSIDCETILHAYLSNFMIRGEWFWPVPELQKIVRRLRAFEHKYPDFADICRNVVNGNLGKSLKEIYGEVPIDLIINHNLSDEQLSTFKQDRE